MQSHTIIAQIPRYHPYPYPLDFLHPTTLFSCFSLASAWGRGVGIFDRFSRNDTLHRLFCSFHFFISSSHLSSSALPSRFLQCLCIVYPPASFFPSLCCFASLYKSITYDNDPTHSGHSSSITDPHSHSFFPLRTRCCTPCYSFRPRQPPLFVRCGL